MYPLRIARTDLGGYIYDADFTVSYGLGMVVDPKITDPESELSHIFPLYVSKTEHGGPWQTLTLLEDPRIEEVGKTWVSPLIQDPLHPLHVLKVELARIDEGIHRYRTKFWFSPDGGKSWYAPIVFPD